METLRHLLWMRCPGQARKAAAEDFLPLPRWRLQSVTRHILAALHSTRYDARRRILTGSFVHSEVIR